MKILFHRPIAENSLYQEDYQCDCVLHGLKQVYGTNCVDYPKIWYMYESELGEHKIEKKHLYGRGFTIFGTLPDDNTDRSDIHSKISSGFFDLVIMDRKAHGELFQFILEHVPMEKIAILDGEDTTIINHGFRFVDTEATFFKREIEELSVNILPISFAFPEEKLQQPMEKTKAIADMIPGNEFNYIFNDEQEYYNEYNRSLFGITHKKGGWDCLRHYEILGARSVPWFKNLEGCPELTCTTLPKNEFKEMNDLIDFHGPENLLAGPLRSRYEDIRERMYQKFVENCTTKTLARYVVNSTLQQTWKNKNSLS